jgi:hypothetical protein
MLDKDVVELGVVELGVVKLGVVDRREPAGTGTGTEC